MNQEWDRERGRLQSQLHREQSGVKDAMSPRCGAWLQRGWETSVVTRRKVWDTKKKKTELVVYPEPARSQGREGVDEKLVLAPTLC